MQIFLILLSLFTGSLVHSQYYDKNTFEALQLHSRERDEGGEDEGKDEAEPQDPPLTKAGLIAIMDEIQQELVDNAAEQSGQILEKVQQIQDETREFLEELVEIFYVHNKEKLHEAREVIQQLSEKIQDNQMAMFQLTEVLIGKIQEQKEHEIQELKLQIKESLEKFPPPFSSCEIVEGCEECIRRPQCVYCSDTKKCHEGNEYEGVFFYYCAFYLIESCEFPKSDYFFEIPPEVEYLNPLTSYYEFNDMQQDQKKYISKKQGEMISFKNKIDHKRLQMNQMNNITIIIRAKRITLSFEIMRIRNLKEKGLLYENDDDDYEENFLDQIIIDDAEIGQAILKLEEDVREMKNEDEILDEERRLQLLEEQEEEMARKQESYENGGKRKKAKTQIPKKKSSNEGDDEGDQENEKPGKKKKAEDAQVVDQSQHKGGASIEDMFGGFYQAKQKKPKGGQNQIKGNSNHYNPH